MLRTATLLAVAVVLLAATSVLGDVPGTISFQGVLREDTGVVVPDGSYEVVFNLYPGESFPFAVWGETQTVVTTDGIFNVALGEVSPFTLNFDVHYWLSIAIEGESELPRVPFQAVPYAFHALTAEVADTALVALSGDDGDWTQSGDDVYKDSGGVAIGTGAILGKLNVVGDDTTAIYVSSNTGAPYYHPALSVENHGGTAAFFHSGPEVASMYSFPAAVRGMADGDHLAGHFITKGSAQGLLVEANLGATGVPLEVRSYWGGPDAKFIGGGGVDVDGKVRTDAIQVRDGSASGYVLVSDASGNGAWQAPAAQTSDGDWTISGSDLYSSISGNVGIGDDTPESKLTVEDDGISAVLLAKQSGFGSTAAKIERITAPGAGNNILELSAPSGSQDDMEFIECDRRGTDVFAVKGDGQVIAEGGADFGGPVSVSDSLSAVTGKMTAGYFETTSLSGGAAALQGVCSATDTYLNGIGVLGSSIPQEGHGIGGKFEGGWAGVVGVVEGTTAADEPRAVYGYAVDFDNGTVTGLYGLADGSINGEGVHYGVIGRAENGSSSAVQYGVYGSTGGPGPGYGIVGVGSGANDYAGIFTGDTHVNGTFSATTKSFRIDHPLDPEGKYLLHSSVESPDMKNVYDGVVVLDSRGEATVELPEYFEALNQDFRYQLTPVGAPGPNLHVSKEVSDNRFSIAGGNPGMKVSWQITGIRHDPYAAAYPMVVEPSKQEHEVGKYLVPEVYGAPRSAAIHAIPELESPDIQHGR